MLGIRNNNFYVMRLVRIDFYKLKLSFGIISAQQRMAKIKNAMVLSPKQPLRISHVTTKYDKHWECNGPIANRTFAHYFQNVAVGDNPNNKTVVTFLF